MFKCFMFVMLCLQPKNCVNCVFKILAGEFLYMTLFDICTQIHYFKEINMNI